MTAPREKLAVVALAALLVFGAATIHTTQSLLSDSEKLGSNQLGAGDVPSSTPDDGGQSAKAANETGNANETTESSEASDANETADTNESTEADTVSETTDTAKETTESNVANETTRTTASSGKSSTTTTAA